MAFQQRLHLTVELADGQQGGRVAEAEDAFRRSASFDPPFPDGFVALSHLLLRTGRFEEPGALRERIEAADDATPVILGSETPLRCIARPESASPATGSGASHKLEQEMLLNEVFS